MEEYSETILNRMCCTCLSKNRKLSQLSRTNDDAYDFYLLLFLISEAYREAFRDKACLFICWECEAIMRKFTNFRRRACIAQKWLTDIAEGKIDMKVENESLSPLTTHHISTYETVISQTIEPQSTTNDIEHSSAMIKTENDNVIPLEAEHCDISCTTDDEDADIPLEEENCDIPCTTEDEDADIPLEEENCDIPCATEDEDDDRSLAPPDINTANSDVDDKETNRDVPNEENEEECANNDGNSFIETQTTCQSDEEIDSKVNGEPEVDSVETTKKCELCGVEFKNSFNLERHKKRLHFEDESIRAVKKNLVSNPPKMRALIEKKTPLGYKCSHCGKYFENRFMKYKHIRHHHNELLACSVCGKRFAYRDSLEKHERLHREPLPRKPCPVCKKMIRIDLARNHSKIHMQRESHTCTKCDKKFVSLSSYESHLKNSIAHAPVDDLLKYKCLTCEKGYRTKVELRDHTNYKHLGTTQHKCPICSKALVSRRSIAQHIRRAHREVEESPRDKICKECGKGFKDTKCLREHELIHTGERPLFCNICGDTFRQSGSLYSHRRRVHKLQKSNKYSIRLVED